MAEEHSPEPTARSSRQRHGQSQPEDEQKPLRVLGHLELPLAMECNSVRDQPKDSMPKVTDKDAQSVVDKVAKVSLSKLILDAVKTEPQDGESEGEVRKDTPEKRRKSSSVKSSSSFPSVRLPKFNALKFDSKGPEPGKAAKRQSSGASRKTSKLATDRPAGSNTSELDDGDVQPTRAMKRQADRSGQESSTAKKQRTKPAPGGKSII